MNVCKGRLLKNPSNQKLNSSCQGWHYMAFNIAFHLQSIWLQTLVVIKFRSIQNHSWHCFQAFARRHLKSLGCWLQLSNSNLSRRPFLGQVVDLDLLLCTGFDTEHLFLCHILTQRPMTDWKIEQSNGRCFGLQQLLANFIENFISHEKKNPSSRPDIYKLSTKH